MKFRARMSNVNFILLHDITTQLQKICGHGSSAILYLDEEQIKFALLNESVAEKSKCYAELSVNKIFLDYRIESQSNNTILLEIGIENLVGALNSGKNIDICQFKLTKRDDKPYLSFETIESITISHDIPIRLIKISDLAFYSPPNVQSPTVALEFPKSKLLKNLIEKLGKFSKYIDIIAFQSGRLIIQANKNLATVKTYCNNLKAVFDNAQLSSNTHARNKAVIRVEVKSLSYIISLIHNLVHRTLAYFYITNNSSLVVHVNLLTDVGNITYYMPVVILEDDEVNSLLS